LVHDVFGNRVTIAQFAGRGQELRFESVIHLDHSPSNALDFTIAAYAEKYPFTYRADEMPDLSRSCAIRDRQCRSPAPGPAFHRMRRGRRSRWRSPTRPDRMCDGGRAVEDRPQRNRTEFPHIDTDIELPRLRL
jgi:hypothetical protein